MLKDNEEYVEFKFDIASIKGVEILEAGTWIDMNGRKIVVTIDDIDEMITNFKNNVREPILNLDHDDRFTEKVRESLRVVGLGFVSELKRNGKKLVADFKQVPVKLAELINAGSLKKRSSEFVMKGFRSAGNIYNNVLTAVSFFGHDAPAINTLNNDFEVVFEALLQMDDHKLIQDNQEKVKVLYKEKQTMATIEIEKSEYQELLGMKSKNEVLVTQKEVLEGENKKLKSSVTDLTVKADELVSLKSKVEKDQEEVAEKEATVFVEKAISDGHIQSKFKDLYVSQYKGLQSDEVSLKLFKEELTSRKVDVPNEEIKFGSPDNKSAKTGDEMSDDEVAEQIEVNMKKNNSTWDEEAVKLGLPVGD